MHISLTCPACSTPIRQDVADATTPIACPRCDWSRSIEPATIKENQPTCCLVCGTKDLWRQKDFPQHLGLLAVALGAILSTIAWWYLYPVLAIGILMFFALGDFLLYTLMDDVLVCYRCRAKHHKARLTDDLPRFDLEVAERYRQEEIRLKATSKPQP